MTYATSVTMEGRCLLKVSHLQLHFSVSLLLQSCPSPRTPNGAPPPMYRPHAACAWSRTNNHLQSCSSLQNNMHMQHISVRRCRCRPLLRYHRQTAAGGALRRAACTCRKNHAAFRLRISFLPWGVHRVDGVAAVSLTCLRRCLSN